MTQFMAVLFTSSQQDHRGKGGLWSGTRADIHVGAGALGPSEVKRLGFSPIRPHCQSMEQGREIQMWHCNNNPRNYSKRF